MKNKILIIVISLYVIIFISFVENKFSFPINIFISNKNNLFRYLFVENAFSLINVTVVGTK